MIIMVIMFLPKLMHYLILFSTFYDSLKWNNDALCIFSRAEVGTIFALSWLITWFGHVLSDFRHVVRLYDFFLACHPLMPIYFAAVVSLLTRLTECFYGQTALSCSGQVFSVSAILGKQWQVQSRLLLRFWQLSLTGQIWARFCSRKHFVFA